MRLHPWLASQRVRALRAVATAVLAAVVLTATALAGLPYVWCAPMGQARLSACCPQRNAPHTHGPAVDAPCCEARRVLAPPAATHTLPDVPVAPPPGLLALLPLSSRYTPGTVSQATATLRHVQQPRAGPPPRLYALHARWLC